MKTMPLSLSSRSSSSSSSVLGFVALVTTTVLTTSTTTPFVAAKDYDFIVVGAGAAGSIVASRLVNQLQADVLLLEAGGDNSDPKVSNLLQGYFDVAFNPFNYGFLQWGYETTAQTFDGASPDFVNAVIGGDGSRPIDLPQGRVIGGSHSINAGAYVQGHSSDYDNVAEDIGDNDWSFDRTKGLRQWLESQFDLVEYGLDNQVGAAEYVETAHETLGLPYNADPNNGDQYGIAATFWTAMNSDHGGLRVSSYDAFVTPILGNPFDRKSDANQGSIDVITYTVVENLIFDDTDATKVIGVSTYNTRSQNAFEFYATSEVILSAGAYNTPKILMLSGIGNEDHLSEFDIATRVHLPGVGENLRDHYAVGTFWQQVDLPPNAPLLFLEPTFNVFGPESEGPPSYQMELSGNFASLTPLRQDQVGTVRLQSTSPFDAPLIDPNALDTAGDIDRIVVGLQTILIPFFKSLVEQNLLAEGNFNLSWNEEELKSFIIENLVTNHHPSGTAKVGRPDDEMAVVDKDFKVYGTTGLRVVDASVFQLCPSGNTLASTMTLAMLATKKMRQEYVGDDDSHH